MTAKHQQKEKILLVLLPFWDPQIPPLGISCLKAYLRQNNYPVTIADANVEQEFREIYYRYYDILEECIPPAKRGNFFNTGNVVLRNHMMAHINHSDEATYIQLVKILVHESFYCPLDDAHIRRLNAVMEEFYDRLEGYFLRLLDARQPDVIGFSLFSGTLPASMFAARLTREKFPHIRIYAGGGIFSDQLAAGTPDMEYFLERTQNTIDKIIIGEGEVLFLKLLNRQLPDTARVYDRSHAAGETVALDRVDIPDFNDLDLTYYPHISMYGSRSCPYQCSFCSETVNWGAYRKKTPQHVVTEMTELYRRTRYQLFMFADSLLNPVVSGIAGQVIASGETLYWDGFLRADTEVCRVENTMQWRRGGFYRAKLGLESGSPKILEMMGKKITLQQVQEALFSLAHAGIKTTTFWVIGHPGETEEDFQMTLDMLEKLKDTIYEADCNPFYYHLSGQVESDNWMAENKSKLLYPAWAREHLISQTWQLDCEPNREEAIRRVNRFVQHCKKLGIPNPYSLKEIHAADERWKNLHANAVPPLIEFMNKETRVHESREVRTLSFARNPLTEMENDPWL